MTARKASRPRVKRRNIRLAGLPPDIPTKPAPAHLHEPDAAEPDAKPREKWINPSQEQIVRFVSAYLFHRNGKNAAIAAGYAESNAKQAATLMLRSGKVLDELDRRMTAHLARARMTAQDVLDRIEEIADLDAAKAYDVVVRPDGSTAQVLKPLHLMPPDVRRAIASIKTVRQNLGTGDGVVDEVIEVKFWNKTAALQLRAEAYGLLKKVVEHDITLKRLETMPDEELLAHSRAKTEQLERAMAARAKLTAAIAHTQETGE